MKLTVVSNCRALCHIWVGLLLHKYIFGRKRILIIDYRTASHCQIGLGDTGWPRNPNSCFPSVGISTKNFDLTPAQVFAWLLILS